MKRTNNQAFSCINHNVLKINVHKFPLSYVAQQERINEHFFALFGERKLIVRENIKYHFGNFEVRSFSSPLFYPKPFNKPEKENQQGRAKNTFISLGK